MILHRSPTTSPKRLAGFSLIEVMVAVVILATGLLALAALQGALARNSSDAKARSAIMAALTSRMNEIRKAPPTSGKTWTMTDAWVSDAATQAGTGNLKVVESLTTFRWNGTGYVTTAVTKPLSTYTRASLQASWTAADGSKSLAISSDMSGWIYGDGSGYGPPDNDSSASVRPVVRQSNPGIDDGVIPIAVSDDPNSQSTAASNPKPLLIGQTRIVGTQFDVLSYIPEGDEARLTRRINTNVIKCRCQFGQTSPNTGVAGKAQWPTVWNGVKYETYVSASAAPGVDKKAGEDPGYSASNGRKQSPLCTECCRDHHDNGTGEAYSPEGVATKYDADKDGVLTAASSGKYVAACRVIKSEGLWKTASDMYVRQYGLLASTPSPAPEPDSPSSITPLDTDSEKQAMFGAPDSRATKAYQTFVKKYLNDYLSSITTTGSALQDPAEAKAMYDGYVDGVALKDPELITIPKADVDDKRYMHSRGLLVDHLTQKARTALLKAIHPDNCKKTDKRECLLPQLPFTTINMTELARWSEEDGALNVVDSGTLLATDVNEPFAGRTRGMAPTTKSTVTSTTRFSNSGIAFSHDIKGAVRPEAEEAALLDTQDFAVLGGLLTGLKVAVSGYQEPLGTFTVTLTQPQTSACNPASGGGLRCPVGGLPAGVTMKVAEFNKTINPGDDEADLVTVICTPKNAANPVSDIVPMPYTVSYKDVFVGVNGGAQASASISGVGSAAIATWISSGNVNQEDTLDLRLDGRTKSCPLIYTCNTKSTTLSVDWPDKSDYVEANDGVCPAPSASSFP